MKYYGTTDRGKLRKSNQDNYVIATNMVGDVFAIVCDGIGGSRGGDLASRMCVDYFSEKFSTQQGFASVDEARQWLRVSISEVNRLVYNYGKEEQLDGMGTTLSGVLISQVATFIINIGDSRVYAHLIDGTFKQMTVDHTLVQDMIMHGEISIDDAAEYPRKNVLTNAIGVWDTVKSDISTHYEPINGFLICSDGLHGYVPLEDIKEVVLNNKLDPSLRVRKLLKMAMNAGGYDNITLILIDLEGK